MILSHLPALIQVIALMLSYSFADRFGGGGWPSLDAKLPGRAVFWGGILAGLVSFLLAGPVGAFLALGWLAYRTPGWKLVPAGSMTPYGPLEALGTFGRHALVLLPFFLASAWFGLSPLYAVRAALGYALWGTALGLWYGAWARAARRKPTQPTWDPNAYVEALRGAGYGLAVAFALGLPMELLR